MTPRERVRCALAHRQPDRVPFSWGFGPTPEARDALRTWYAAQGIDFRRLAYRIDDIARLHSPYIGPPPADGTDQWGIHWRMHSYGIGTYHELGHYPLAGATTVRQIEAHPWPDPADFDDEALIEQADRAEGRALLLSGGNPFEIYCWLTGLEESLANLVLEPELVHAALERITGIFEARLERAAALLGDRLDLWFFADDLGGQQGPLLSRRCYGKQLQPYHRRLTAVAEVLTPGAYRLFHSDGSVYDLLDDLLDAGVQVLEAVQTDCAKMEPERLKAAYAGRLAFCGAISVQQSLPHAEPSAVAEECRRLVRVLGDGGGYIATPSHAIQAGTPPANVAAMLEAVLGDDFAAALDQSRLR